MPLTRRAVLKAGASVLAGTAAGVLSHGYAYERFALQVIREDLPVWGLAPEHDGVRIGLITDLHHSEFTNQADIGRAVALLMAQRPDLVVLGGDYVSMQNRRYMEPCAEALGPLAAPNGVFAILGNHDDDRDMPAALARRGFAVLRDRRTTITVNGAPLALAGIRFWTRQTAAIRRIVTGSTHPTILLAHDPRRLTEAADLTIPAVLSGHTHGGQIVLPFLGPLATRNFPVLAGIASRGRTRIFVSRGVGTVYVPVRVNCPPDVALLTLRPWQASSLRDPEAFR
jgi:predicted MPP superfamily phosphohydrolase